MIILQFGKENKKGEMKMRKSNYTLIELAMVLGILGVVICGCGGLYVAIHFIAKFW